MKLKTYAGIFIILCARLVGADVAIVNRAGLITEISAPKLLASAAAWYRSFDEHAKVLECRKVLYFEDQHPICIAAEMIVEAEDHSQSIRKIIPGSPSITD
jgi:hypothetical protein